VALPLFVTLLSCVRQVVLERRTALQVGARGWRMWIHSLDAWIDARLLARETVGALGRWLAKIGYQGLKVK
jgi:hypothetical protein